MEKKINYRVSTFDTDEIPSRVIDEDWSAASIFIGLRLEDLKSEDDAYSAGFEKVDDITFIGIKRDGIRICLNDMRSTFISSYIFQAKSSDALPMQASKQSVARYVRNSIIGPLNQSKRKKNIMIITTNNAFFSEVDRIIMLDSMESTILVLDKETDKL